MSSSRTISVVRDSSFSDFLMSYFPPVSRDLDGFNRSILLYWGKKQKFWLTGFLPRLRRLNWFVRSKLTKSTHWLSSAGLRRSSREPVQPRRRNRWPVLGPTMSARTSSWASFAPWPKTTHLAPSAWTKPNGESLRIRLIVAAETIAGSSLTKFAKST